MEYHHIVLFKLHGQVNDVQVQQAIQFLKSLGSNNPEILKWEVALSVDTRKGKVIIENAVFVNRQAFDKFRASDKHTEVGNFMKEISDWLVGDYEQ